jgi:hypothetical protein
MVFLILIGSAEFEVDSPTPTTTTTIQNNSSRYSGVLTGDVWRRDPNIVSAFKAPPGKQIIYFI